MDDAGYPERRLLIVSAGNVDAMAGGYLERCDTTSVEDPAQAWNALTIGAYTELATIPASAGPTWTPLAPAGDLSPWSSTSLTFSAAWPLKPDVVFEGGNIAHDGNGQHSDRFAELQLLTTHHDLMQRAFTLTCMTSAACAQAARFTATIVAEYRDLWPETIRALTVHSAQWTTAMKTHLQGDSRKRSRERLIRRYGFGVPNLEKALRSANDALTLIVQGTIRPFNDGKMREMHVHELPWPTEVLESLGEAPVTLRVTLSYFIEPNPGRRGWKTRHRYCSHGLRFAVKLPTDDIEQFRKSMTHRALAEDEAKPDNASDSMDWYLGEQARNRGSIHSDFWNGTAADLAAKGAIGIYPVSGWWKDLPKRDRSEKGVRYSLVVSIETPTSDVDIWSPVATQVGVPLESSVEL